MAAIGHAGFICLIWILWGKSDARYTCGQQKACQTNWICLSDMDFNVTEVIQSISLFQLPVPLKLRKILMDLTNQ